ncbi:MAG: ribonuclease Y [Bacteroidetes bacterium]|jgi:ribonuclease Y|nr:ribonuclease Y [Bacteroidota bacterium]
METVVFSLAGILIGLALGYVVFILLRRNQIESERKSLIEEAKLQGENLKKDRILEAKEKYMALKSEHEKEINRRNQEMSNAENRIRQKEQSWDQKLQNVKQKEDELAKARETFEAQMEGLKTKQREVEAVREQQLQQLEKIAGLSAAEAKEQMLENIRIKSHTEGLAIAKNIVEEAKLSATRDAKRIVLQTIQRTAAETAIDNTVTSFPLENDDVKGRIIGREGRNIKAFEAATGVEILIDDTPETIVLSCYDPIRREIARVSLERLIKDGRIHPARIEEVVEKTKKQIEEEVVEWGERTVVDLGITGLHPELIRYVGRMRFRSSFGQNLLKHSREVARLCATMAAEMGLNVKLAKRAGLLHDIGKVPDTDEETPHALLGMKLCEKYGEHPEVINAVGAHHDEIEMTSLLSPVIQACDAISGSRPGARRGDEQYVQRIKDMETMALGYPGVEKAFAIQAGRELRIIMSAEKSTDDQADVLAFEISNRIMTEMRYPGQVKITVIREKRSVGVAK